MWLSDLEAMSRGSKEGGLVAYWNSSEGMGRWLHRDCGGGWEEVLSKNAWLVYEYAPQCLIPIPAPNQYC